MSDLVGNPNCWFSHAQAQDGNRAGFCAWVRSMIFSESAWPIKAKFYMKHLLEGGTNVHINNPGHMTKMVAMSIYGKKHS